MADIASALPPLPAAPQGQMGVVPIASAPSGTDAAMPDFLGLLKTALKSLTAVVSPMPANAAPGEVIVAAATASSASDQQPTPAKADDDKSLVETDLAQVVVALGLMVTPTLVKVEPTATPGTAAAKVGDAMSAPTAPVTSQPLQQRAPAPTVPPQDPPTADSVKEDANKSIDIGAFTPSAPSTPSMPPVQTMPAPAPTTHVAKEAVAAASQQVTDAANPAPVTAPQTYLPKTSAAAPLVTTPVTIQPAETHVQNGNSSFQHSGNDDAAQDDRGTPVVESTPPDHTFAVMAETVGTTAAQTTTAQPQAVHPGAVVSQIAHQADLFKLPGNKGVRIQLHPEDLGGVQVTLRHAAGGGLELHIAVEHAATGALVQSGWSELRDALTSQGFSPERLVMSVSAAGNANQLDFSSNGGNGYRSDANLAAFADGGQSGQRRESADADGARAPGGWTSHDETSPITDTASRTAGMGAPSRIDYRV